VDFVVVMSPDRTRYTHPDPALIGGRYVGTVAPAVDGGTVTEVSTGSLGPSVRAVVPVEQAGRVVALVAVGITLTRVGDELLRQLPAVALVSGLALALAAAGAALVSRRLRRQTLGLEPAEITRMYEAHDAVLHAVREGLLVLDPERCLQLANDEALRLLGLPADVQGRSVEELALPGPLSELLRSGRATQGEVHLAAERVLLVEQAPAVRDGRVLGTVATLRDTTELQEVTGELDSVRGLADALGSQAHEAANRLHTVLTLVELGRLEEAVELGVAELRASQALTDRVLAGVEEPVLAALLLGKAAVASERGIELVVTDDTALPRVDVDARDLVTVVGNLVDNALDAALAGSPPRRVAVTVRADGRDLLVRVADSGPGLTQEQRALAFTRGWSSKPDTSLHGRGLGLALVRQVVDRLGGSVDVRSEAGAVFTVVLPGAVP
jgi:two-component system CitB family sensor kinase